MTIELNLSNGGPLEFKPGLPPGYAGPILRGAIALSAKTNNAQLVIQELSEEHYSIRLIVGRFFKKINASGYIRGRGLYSYFMLKSGVRKEIASLGKLHLRQDQYACFFTEPTPCKARLEENTEFRALDLFYSPKLVEELLPFFPELKEVLLASPGIMLPGKTGWTLPSMKEITNQLLNCPYDEVTRRFYFDLKVRELLYQILENAYKRNLSAHFFTPWEIEKIHKARAILGEYISKNPPTIRSLARQVDLSEFKLKTGFRQFFNASIFDWLMEERMHHAKELLLITNKPIKDICSLVGFTHTTNFIISFRRRFGMTPGSLRRK
jgi:AraC-like DNA-binding protein